MDEVEILFPPTVDLRAKLLDALRLIEALTVNKRDSVRHGNTTQGSAGTVLGDCVFCGHSPFVGGDPPQFGHEPTCAWKRAKRFLATGEAT